MFPFMWRPKPGRFGVMPEAVGVGLGSSGVTISNSATTTIVVPGSGTGKVRVNRIVVAGPTAAGSAGTVTLQVRKNNGTTQTNLTAATSIKSDVLTASGLFVWAVTASDINRVMSATEWLEVLVVASGTVTTQPNLTLSVELGAQE